jgi:hypothetical protein
VTTGSRKLAIDLMRRATVISLGDDARELVELAEELNQPLPELPMDADRLLRLLVIERSRARRLVELFKLI